MNLSIFNPIPKRGNHLSKRKIKKQTEAIKEFAGTLKDRPDIIEEILRPKREFYERIERESKQK